MRHEYFAIAPLALALHAGANVVARPMRIQHAIQRRQVLFDLPSLHRLAVQVQQLMRRFVSQ